MFVFPDPNFLSPEQRDRMYLTHLNARLATEVQELHSKIIELEKRLAGVGAGAHTPGWHEHTGRTIVCEYKSEFEMWVARVWLDGESRWLRTPIEYCPYCGAKLEAWKK